MVEYCVRIWPFNPNQANPRDLITVVDLVFLFKLDSNRWFFSLCDLEIWWMTYKTIGHLFCIMSSFVHRFKGIGKFKLELQSGNTQCGSKSEIFFVLCDLEIWQMTLKNNRAALLYCLKLCVSFQSHRWIRTGVTVQKPSIRVKIGEFFVPCDFEIWQMTLKNKRAPLLCCLKLCESFCSSQWIQIGVNYSPETPTLGQNRWFFCPVWPWNLMDDLEKQ